MKPRFLLLFHPRSGSNLVATALTEHPAVVMYGELFHHLQAAREHLRPVDTPGPCAQCDCYRDGADPVAFLQDQLFNRSFPPERTAFGFKLSPLHLRRAANARICALLGTDPGPDQPGEASENRFWQWLSADREIRVISLYRQSLLETMVSALVALQTNQWLQPIGTAAKTPKQDRLHVPVDQFRQFVDLMTADRERALALFAGHPLLDLEYQKDVADQFDLTMRRIEEFLGVPPLALRKQLEKQSRTPIRERVINYAELHLAVAGTRYEAYL
jgi:hypothetical protein